jgi:copper(I)-binding protein
MVSRQTTRPLRKLVPAAAIGVSALLGIVGCSAGQVAQTAGMEPAVNGNSAQVGTIALRNVLVAFPEGGETYREGDDAPLLLAIVNTGPGNDELVGATSPAGQVAIVGNPSIPAGTSLQVVLPEENASATTTTTTTTESAAASSSAETSETTETSGSSSASSSSGAPSGTSEAPSQTEAVSPPEVGTVSIIITGLTSDLPFGKNVPVTFEFAKAGKVTVQLPVGAPATPRPEATKAESEH